MPKSIWDTRFTPPKVALDADVEAAFLALDEWITIKGTHVELGENGEILHGMGGKFKNVHDVPRKTVKQRKGESIEQTHERAREVFAKQDAKKQQKQETDDERMQRLMRTPMGELTPEEREELGGLQMGPNGWTTRGMRYEQAMEQEESGRPNSLKKWAEQEREYRTGGQQRQQQNEREQQYKQAYEDKQDVQREISRMPKAEHEQYMKEREERPFVEWTGSSAPAYVENEYIDRQVREGRYSEHKAQKIKESVSMRAERENLEGDKLQVSFYNPKGMPSGISEWIPKRYLVSELDAENIKGIPF